jgi:hypothetical protein
VVRSAQALANLREKPWFRGLAAFAAYLVASVLWFGLPVLPDLGSSVVGALGFEQSISIWSLEWWPHAVGEGLNLFNPEVIFAPDGFNLAWATSIPGPSAFGAPLTLAFGPVVTFNVWAILAPALSGWTTFLLCHQVTRSFWPSLAGGYVFAFSSYTLAATLGHLNLALVAALPAAAYLFLRHLEGSLGDRGFVLLMAAALAFQFLTFTETFATMTMFAVVAVGAAILLFPERRRELWRSSRATVIAFGVAALALSPYLYYALGDREAVEPVNIPENFSTDPLNLVVPTVITEIGGGALTSISGDFTGSPSEQYAYVGLPLLLILGLLTIETRTRRPARLLLAVAGVALILSMGPELHLGGQSTDVPLPWWPLAEAPLMEFALPARVLVYAWIALAVAVALWLASPGRAVPRWALAIVVAISLAPNLGKVEILGEDRSPWHADVSTPAFFERGDYRRFLGPGETIMVFPYGFGGLGMLWQSETDMDFAMAGGYISASSPPEYRCWPIVRFLQYGLPVADPTRELLAFAWAKRVAIAVTPRDAPDPLRAPLATLGIRPLARGGMSVYRLPGAGGDPRPRPDCPT